MKDRRVVLTDLDDTLYACRPGEDAGGAAVIAAVATTLDLAPAEVKSAFDAGRAAVKRRIDGTGSSHSRLLYLAEMVHALRRPDALVHVRAWEDAYWTAFIDAIRLRARVMPFLETARRAGVRVGIVSDLTLAPQLRKIDRLGLARHIDALVTSEEAPLDKPDSRIFEAAFARLGVTAKDCVVIGDRDDKDGEGARRLGMPYVILDAKNDHEGEAFDRLAKELGLGNA